MDRKGRKRSMNEELPNIERLEARPDHVLRVKFRKQGWKAVSLKDLIVREKAMAALLDPAIFRKAKVVDWGAGVGWPSDLDIGASTLWHMVDEPISRRDRNV